MDFNQLLIWFVIFSCFVLLIRAVLFRQKRGWFIVYGSILAITILFYYLAPEIAGLIGAALWIVFLFLPLMGFLKVNQMVEQQRYEKAYQLANYLRWVHPADGWLEQPDILRALEMGKRGEIRAAFKILNRYSSGATKASRKATALLYAMETRWEELLVWIRVNVPEKKLWQDTHIAVYYLRALGETADINGLLQGISQAQKHLEKTGNLVALNLARMYGLAFCGEVKFVQKLFDGLLVTSSWQVEQFWLATAKMAKGDGEEAREQLLTLKESSKKQNSAKKDRVLENAINWRLMQSQSLPQQELSATSQQILARLKADIRQEVRYDIVNHSSSKKPYATYILLVLNLLIFAVEVAFLEPRIIPDFLWWGIQDIECTQNNCDALIQINTVLSVLGGLIPEAVIGGQWWRILNANFLHFGLLHLVMNMLGLYVLGPFVEFTLGVRRFFFAYLASGIGAMFAFTLMHIFIDLPEQMLVGASAAVIGLLGVIGAILLQGWLKERSSIAGRRLRLFAIIIAVQIAVDSSIPQISGESHIFGLVIGFLIGSLLLINWQFED